MSSIGLNHFLDQLEELPGEEIMWEGGASLLGVVIQFIPTVGFIVFVAAFFLLPAGIANHLYIDNPDYVEPQHISNENELSNKQENSTTESGTENKQTEPKVILNRQLVRLLILAGIPLLWRRVLPPCCFVLKIIGLL